MKKDLLQKDSVRYGIPALLLIVAGALYLGIPQEFIIPDEQQAINIADSNELVQQYKEGRDVTVSSNGVTERTVNSLKTTDTIPEDTSSDVYVVDYTAEGEPGVSVYVDLGSDSIVGTKRNLQIN